MDTSAVDITFDDGGICNYCCEFLVNDASTIFMREEERDSKRKTFIDLVKKHGANKRYDCIVGLSGGVDSAFTLYTAVSLGLRPLAVHMDNGWNSELAQNNIENLVKRLGVDLYTHVIDWPEYRGLMQAFFEADVIDVELLYDNAMLALNYRLASKHGVRYILSGHNASTEGMRMPPSWNWLKFDARNIRAIAKEFGPQIRIRSFPIIGTKNLVWYRMLRRISWVRFLDFVDYNKESALKVLEQDFQYKRYPYKHYESIFTRFYQGHLLPVKFGVDKRRVHLSSLIISGQLGRLEALVILEGIPYPSSDQLNDDIRYFLKKMLWSASDLADYLKRGVRRHDEFGSEYTMWKRFVKVYKLLVRSSAGDL